MANPPLVGDSGHDISDPPPTLSWYNLIFSVKYNMRLLRVLF